MRRLSVAIVVLALGVVAPAAEAVAPQQAREIAERVIAAAPEAGPFDPPGELIPAQRRFRPIFEIHTLRRVLKRGALVGQGVERRRSMYRVRAPALLAWVDYAPGAGFAHRSRLVLIDRRSRRVVHNRVIAWWPEVNNRRVFARGRGRRVTPRNAPGRRRGSAAVVPGFRNDCLVTIGDRIDPYFLKGHAAMSAMARRHGMPSAAARTPGDLGPAVDRLAAADPPCTDVIIYVAGNGYAPPNVQMPDVATSDTPAVLVRVPGAGGTATVEEKLDANQIKKLVRARPHLSFKFVIEACFSGAWTTVMAEPNMRITLTSSRAHELTFLAVTDPRQGRQVNGRLELRGGEIGEPDEAGDPPPFTAGVIRAIDDFAADPANANAEAGKALSYAGTHREGDRARTLGWQSGRTDDRTGQRPHASPSLNFTLDGSYRHIGPGSSETCWTIQTQPPTQAQVTITVTGPNGYSKSGAGSTGPSGRVLIRAPINEYGTYTATVTVTGQNGTSTRTATVTVTASQGTCSAP